MAVTPHAIAGYGKNLYVKDTEGKYAKNKYKFEVAMPKGDPAVEDFVKGIVDAHEQAGGNDYCPIKDGDTLKTKSEFRKGWGAGNWIFSAKSDYKPELVDSAKNYLGDDIEIRSGDKVKMMFDAKKYDTMGGGLTCYLKAVMLIEKSEGTSGAAKGFEEEDGYQVQNSSDAFSEASATGGVESGATL